MHNREDLFVKMALDAWTSYIKRTDALFQALSNDELMNEVAPERNRGIYLLGHLTCVHDRMLPLLGLENQRHPDLDNIFHDVPDKSVPILPATAELRNYWSEVNESLEKHFERLSPIEWFQKHAAVSAEDFEKEPHRNKLNVVINRTNHLATHFGQLIFLKSR